VGGGASRASQLQRRLARSAFRSRPPFAPRARTSLRAAAVWSKRASAGRGARNNGAGERSVGAVGGVATGTPSRRRANRARAAGVVAESGAERVFDSDGAWIPGTDVTF
jgi:hypothetical protein